MYTSEHGYNHNHCTDKQDHTALIAELWQSAAAEIASYLTGVTEIFGVAATNLCLNNRLIVSSSNHLLSRNKSLEIRFTIFAK